MGGGDSADAAHQCPVRDPILLSVERKYESRIVLLAFNTRRSRIRADELAYDGGNIGLSDGRRMAGSQAPDHPSLQGPIVCLHELNGALNGTLKIELI